MQKNI